MLRLLIALGFVVASMMAVQEDTAAHVLNDFCYTAYDDIVNSGMVVDANDIEFLMNSVGCNAETMQRQNGMCARYASRVAHSLEHHQGAFLPYLGQITRVVEQQSSRGHQCAQYEDGAYGFPSKQIDCMVDPRC